jgi:dienelactone hydrolase
VKSGSRLGAATLCIIVGALAACSSHRDAVGAKGATSISAPREEPARVRFTSADGSTALWGEIAFPEGAGPFPAVVVMSPRMCEWYAPGRQEATLTSWGYATFTIDSFAARGLSPAACRDFTVLEPSQTIADAYGALELLGSNARIDARRIALLGFAGEGTTALLSDTLEARQHYSSSGVGFRAFFAFYPYCNLDFVNPPNVYAPERIFAGERDDVAPASRCVDLAERLRKQGADIVVIVYPRAVAGFDVVPSDTNFPVQDPSALHPGSTTISTHPQYDPWGENLSACMFQVSSVFDVAKRSDVKLCLRRGGHFQGDATTADDAKRDLRTALDALVEP